MPTKILCILLTLPMVLLAENNETKTLKDMSDLKNVYKAITNKELE